MKAGGKLAPGMGNFGIFEIEEPQITNDNDVLFRVTSIGMCGTDVSIYKWTETAAKYNPAFPLVTGHEMAGIVEAIGKNVTKVKVGDLVTVDEHIACMHCEDCKDGLHTNICKERVVLGCHVNGALTEKFVVREENVFKLPDNIPAWAGSIAEPLAVCIHATEVLPAEPGDLCVVFGSGTIGLGVALKLIKDGCKVIIVDINDGYRMQLAKEFGCITCLSTQQDLMELIHEQGKEFADKAYECVGSVEAVINNAIHCVKPTGAICQVGIAGHPMAIDIGDITMNEKTLYGPRAFVHATWPKTIDFLAKYGDEVIKLITHRLPLDDFAKGIEMIMNGECIKVVINPTE